MMTINAIVLPSSFTCKSGEHDFVPEFEIVQLRNGLTKKYFILTNITEWYLNHRNRSKLNILYPFFARYYFYACRNAATLELSHLKQYKVEVTKPVSLVWSLRSEI